ncbi:hypothetical protein B0O99DRAFT_144533 [Bisporella sp. PMI_857]|nr:hypothetical protein B0O99DRAFT_144533 [Bisporella sp. PMI_857]
MYLVSPQTKILNSLGKILTVASCLQLFGRQGYCTSYLACLGYVAPVDSILVACLLHNVFADPIADSPISTTTVPSVGEGFQGQCYKVEGPCPWTWSPAPWDVRISLAGFVLHSTHTPKGGRKRAIGCTVRGGNSASPISCKRLKRKLSLDPSKSINCTYQQQLHHVLPFGSQRTTHPPWICPYPVSFLTVHGRGSHSCRLPVTSRHCIRRACWGYLACIFQRKKNTLSLLLEQVATKHQLAFLSPQSPAPSVLSQIYPRDLQLQRLLIIINTMTNLPNIFQIS